MHACFRLMRNHATHIMLWVLFCLCIPGLAGCGGSGGGGVTSVPGAAPLPGVPVGSVTLLIPATVPNGTQQFRVRAFRPDTTVEIAPAAVIPVIPLGRVGTADEVAKVILWLLSDEASYVTGALVPIGGGR